MAWKNLIGQATVKNLLQRAILEDRIAHSYCFIGSEGVGKEAFAIEFAKVVNCERHIINEKNIDACGSCISCKMMGTLQHPNVQMIYSLPAPKAMDSRKDIISEKLSDEQIREIQEQNALKAANPYHKINLGKATQIKIAQIRELKRGLSLTANSQGRRCILVFRAEEMTLEAANAFLKTLEEPHSNTTIIMTTSEPQKILPTILSRCQQVFFQSLPDRELEDYLIDRFKLDLTEAKLAVSIGQGSYSKAIEYLDEDMKLLRNNVVDLFRTALKKRIYRSELVNKLQVILNEKDKNLIDKVLIILLLWLRDAMNVINQAAEKTIINVDQIAFLKSFAKNFANLDLSRAIVLVEEAVSNNRRNVNQQLLLINLFIELRREVLSRSNT